MLTMSGPTQLTNVPPNCTFLIDDATADWAFLKKFDFIYVRIISTGIKDWPHVFNECFKSLKPSGKVEMQEWGAHLDVTMVWRLWMLLL